MRIAQWAMMATAAVACSCGGAASVDGAPSTVATIAIDPPSSTLVVGAVTPLTAMVQDASGTRASGVIVLWTTRDTAIATVSPAGVVTAHAVGSTQVAASANGVSAIAAIDVRPAPVATVVVEPATRAVVLGQTASLTATTRDASAAPLAGRAVKWSTSDGAIATVSSSGDVTGIALGTATITATSEGVSGSATVTVTRVPVATVSITPASGTVTVGQTATLSAGVKDANGVVVSDRVVVWSSSDSRIVTVSTSGVVRGVAPGLAVITATSEGVSGTAAVAVVSVAVGRVTVLPTSVIVRRGATTLLTATVSDVNGAVMPDQQVGWSSSNTAVASVSATGVVTGNAVGTATITATSGGKSATAAVTVQPPVAFVIVSPGLVFMRKGGTVQLDAVAYDADGNRLGGRTITWTSNDPGIATVSATGLVTAKGTGVVQVTATIEGQSDWSLVTVTN